MSEKYEPLGAEDLRLVVRYLRTELKEPKRPLAFLLPDELGPYAQGYAAGVRLALALLNFPEIKP